MPQVRSCFQSPERFGWFIQPCDFSFDFRGALEPFAVDAVGGKEGVIIALALIPTIGGGQQLDRPDDLSPYLPQAPHGAAGVANLDRPIFAANEVAAAFARIFVQILA